MQAPWEDVLEGLHFAFQPIVDVHTGSAFGYEALLRGWEDYGFASPHALFDSAFRNGTLHTVDVELRSRALEAFCRISGRDETMLFYNLDQRVLDAPDYEPGKTREVAAQFGVDPGSICLEISERHDAASSRQVSAILEQYREQGFLLALDDYGTGYSGLQLLYQSEPHFIKIDRFFIADISRSERKWAFVANVVSLAKQMGVTVIGEGVETAQDMRVCREVGCDLLQGYYIQRPTARLDQLRVEYGEHAVAVVLV